MAFFLNKTSVFSKLRSHQSSAEGSLSFPRGFHTELGAREKALLADDPSLKRFRSHKKGVRQVKRIGDILTIVVVASCCYEIYVRAVMREEARSGSESTS